MSFSLERIETKIECLQAYALDKLEEMINRQIELNRALLLEVHAVSHHVVFDPNAGKMLYSAVVHFKAQQLN